MCTGRDRDLRLTKVFIRRLHILNMEGNKNDGL